VGKRDQNPEDEVLQRRERAHVERQYSQSVSIVNTQRSRDSYFSAMQ
jgi:hypothetical protein